MSEAIWEAFDGLFKTLHRQGRRVEELEQRVSELERRLQERAAEGERQESDTRGGRGEVEAECAEERAVVERRNTLAEQYKREDNGARRRELLDEIEERTKTYDQMRRERWDRGEVD
jgi:predicted RNase H-like nuclease (RuvC/YqgF family)